MKAEVLCDRCGREYKADESELNSDAELLCPTCKKDANLSDDEVDILC